MSKINKIIYFLIFSIVERCMKNFDTIPKMAVWNNRLCTVFKNLLDHTIPCNRPSVFICRNQPYSVDSNENEEKKSNLSGFAKAFEKHLSIDEIDKNPPAQKIPQTFTSLLRNSKFIDLGIPNGKIVEGTVFHVVGDDLYIDFGWKFHCVCLRPEKNGSEYVRGARVRLRVKDLELSTRFIGSSRDLTLLEADATLIGIISSPVRENR